ncbi:MAG TPA: dynamin family protein [Mycobacteriales bacterium]|nr:dynamin family protein [Mycobacteriales bacterium]
MSTPHRLRTALSDEVDKAVTAAATLLRTVGPDQAAGAGQVERTWPDHPTVVVVGAAKRGKSSLVNALLNTPGLSPVDPVVATGAYLVIQHGRTPAARALMPGGTAPVPIPADRLRDWATVPGDRPEDTPPPRMIEVDCPSPLLANLTLVDTPGMGGLDAAHGEIALAAARSATALLFVLDASAPLTAPELGFLTGASESVDLVVFAVTKIDRYRGWRQIVEDDRELLRRHAPRFADADIVPVSARLFERAGTLPAGDLAATLRTESRVIDLQLLLQTRVAAKSSALHEANALRAARSGLAGLERRLDGDRAALDPDPDRAERLRADRERLARSRRTDARTWQLRLRADIFRARIDTLHEVRREIRDQSHYWRTSLDRAAGADGADRDALDRLPAELDAVLHALALRLFERMVDRLRRVAEVALRDLFTAEECDEVYAGFARAPTPVGPLGEPERREATVEDRLLLVGGVFGGLGASRLVTLAPALLGLAVPAVVFAPLSVGLGVLATRWMVRLRRQVADRNHYRAWIAEALAEARATLENEVAGRFVDAEQSLTLALDQVIARRIEQVDHQIGQIDEALRMDTQDRDRRRGQLDASLALTRGSIERIDGLLPRLRTAGPGSGAPVAALVRLASGAVAPGVFGRPGADPNEGGSA